jgi:hypothetical protein|eukprot:COSAG06_NODE_16421_length_1002_cov_1.279070_2_plen_85_part_01
MYAACVAYIHSCAFIRCAMLEPSSLLAPRWLLQPLAAPHRSLWWLRPPPRVEPTGARPVQLQFIQAPFSRNCPGLPFDPPTFGAA